MRWLETNIKRIRDLIAENTASSLTYAALECRLSLEQVCYDRLRNAHDYISQDDIRKWQPKDVINTLIQEVDPHVASTSTLSVSPDPVPDGSGDLTAEDFSAMEYKEIGTQVGFDAKKLGKLWNALSNFLHVKVPTTKNDRSGIYGDMNALRRKLNEALEELDRLSHGTLIMSGFGETVSFTCECGSVNKRRVALLKAGQKMNCINLNCFESWDVSFEKEEIFFKRRKLSVNCKACEKEHTFPEKKMLDLTLNKIAHFKCDCGETNYIRWSLMQLQKDEPSVP